MSQKGSPKKPKKLTHRDVEPEWRDAVQRRAEKMEVSEHDVIMQGLYYDFKKDKKDEGREAREIERVSLLRQILKELKKGKPK